MEEAKLIIAVVTILISVASFIIARQADVRAKKAEVIKNLLAERETVAFAALKLLRDGLPPKPQERKLVLDALMQACVFEVSDRARALLYRVIEENRPKYRSEIRDAFQFMRETFRRMDHYKFQKDELDLERGHRRISAVEKVVEAT